MPNRARSRRSLSGLVAACLAVTAACADGTAPLPPARPAPQPVSAEDRVPLPLSSPAGFADWRARMRARALAQGISAATFDRAFAGVEPDPEIVELDRFQPEFTRQIWDYLDRAVSETRIANGRRLAGRYADALGRIEATYGVDRDIIVAIWGLESAYGEVKGAIPVLVGTATLAYDGRRRRFFEAEVLAALEILEAGEVAPEGLIGSWAGAMGHTQLLPTNYLRYAVDFDGDGRRDVWGDDPVDALASTGRYFQGFGWETGAPAIRRVTLPQGFDYASADQSLRRPVAAWRAAGVGAADGGPLAEGEAAVLLPAGASGPAWLVYPNFEVIKRYNNATSYALAIALLAQEVSGEGLGIGGLDWPRGDRALSREEKILLQERLTRLGYDTGGIDGRVGPKTRAALRAFQAAQGLVPDGYVSDTVLTQVLRAGG